MTGWDLRVGDRVTLRLPDGQRAVPTVVQERQGRRLAVLAPAEDGLREQWPAGAEVELLFHDERGLYRYWCRVQAWQEGPVPLLWLSEPWSVQRVQRRQSIRLDASLPVRLHREGLTGVGRAIDVGAGGIALLTAWELPVGGVVGVELELPGRTVRAHARVLRRLEDRRGEGYALQFLAISEADREAIYRFLFAEMRLRRQKGLLRRGRRDRG